ncbi:MAG: hypothetical protein AAGG02_10660 [Cyanobacteria bacterium P01_H01_bin.15]
MTFFENHKVRSHIAVGWVSLTQTNLRLYAIALGTPNKECQTTSNA